MTGVARDVDADGEQVGLRHRHGLGEADADGVEVGPGQLVELVARGDGEAVGGVAEVLGLEVVLEGRSPRGAADEDGDDLWRHGLGPVALRCGLRVGRHFEQVRSRARRVRVDGLGFGHGEGGGGQRVGAGGGVADGQGQRVLAGRQVLAEGVGGADGGRVPELAGLVDPDGLGGAVVPADGGGVDAGVGAAVVDDRADVPSALETTRRDSRNSGATAGEGSERALKEVAALATTVGFGARVRLTEGSCVTGRKCRRAYDVATACSPNQSFPSICAERSVRDSRDSMA